MSSFKTISKILADFLADILRSKELLSNKAVHLFLQSQLSLEHIKDNVDGVRDDEVVETLDKVLGDERRLQRDGFRDLFGPT